MKPSSIIATIVRSNRPVIEKRKGITKASARLTYESYNPITKIMCSRLQNKKYSTNGEWSVLTPRILYGYKLYFNLDYCDWHLEPELALFMNKKLYDAVVVGLDNVLYRHIVNQTGPARPDRRFPNANILSINDFDFIPKDEEIFL